MLAKQAIAGRTPTITERGTADPLTGEFTYNPGYQSERDEAQLAALLQRSAAFLGQRQQAADAAAERRQTAVMLAGLNADNARQLAAMRLAETAQQRAQALGEKQQQQLDTQTQTFSKRAEELTPVIYGAAQVQKMLEDYGDKSIPGVGYDALLGPLNSAEGVLNRQKVQVVSNALLKAASGSAVTLSEEARKAAETLANGRYSEAEFRAGWPMIRDSLNEQVSNIMAGTNPAAVAQYRARGGRFAPVAGAAAQGPQTGGATGSWDDAAGPAVSPGRDSGGSAFGGAVDFSKLPRRGH